MARLHKNRDWLKARIDEGLTNEEIGILAGVTFTVISKTRSKFGLQANPLDIVARRHGIIDTRYRNRKWLEQQYTEKPTSAIGKECGVADTTIARWLHKHKIPIHSETYWDRDRLYRSEEWLRQKYCVEGLTLIEMGKLAASSAMIIRKWMIRLGVPVKSRGDRMQERWLAGKPTCVNPGQPTTLENRVAGALTAFDIGFVPQFSPVGTESVYDFFVEPDCLIEVQGKHWHKDDKSKKRDKRKKVWAVDNGFRFFEINEDEMNGIDWIVRLCRWLV